jgi:sirohydrochlorin cobaltochelatase
MAEIHVRDQQGQAGKAPGLLLVGHGTRSALGCAQFLALADRIRGSLAPLPVEPAFLELQQPDIDAAVAGLLPQKIDCIVTVPLLLFAAGHAKQDIPAAVAAAVARRDRTEIAHAQTSHFGCHAALLELSALRMQEVGWAVPTRESTTCLLLVGRGSRDDSATAEMHDFARLRQEKLPQVTVEVAFMAMAQPPLTAQLKKIAALRYDRVIVQPHLLFHGELVESLIHQVAETAVCHPQSTWFVAPVLADGPDFLGQGTKLLENVILDRCSEVGIRVVAHARDD